MFGKNIYMSEINHIYVILKNNTIYTNQSFISYVDFNSIFEINIYITYESLYYVYVNHLCIRIEINKYIYICIKNDASINATYIKNKNIYTKYDLINVFKNIYQLFKGNVC